MARAPATHDRKTPPNASVSDNPTGDSLTRKALLVSQAAPKAIDAEPIIVDDGMGGEEVIGSLGTRRSRQLKCRQCGEYGHQSWVRTSHPFPIHSRPTMATGCRMSVACTSESSRLFAHLPTKLSNLTATLTI